MHWLPLPPTPVPSHPPSFPFSLASESWPASWQAGEVAMSLRRARSYSEPFLVQFSMQQVGPHLHLSLHADPTRVPETALSVLADCLHTLLRYVLGQPQALLAKAPLLSPAA